MVCDIACGVGLHVSKLAKHGCDVLGLDLDRDRIGIAQVMNHGLDCQFQLGDASRLPYRSGVFRRIVSFSALEHFESDGDALAEISRVLDHSGILVMSCDSFTYREDRGIQGVHSTAHGVKRYYTLSTLEHELERVGMKIVESTFYVNSPMSAFFFRIEVLLPALSRLLFPISMPLSIITDRIMAKADGGYFMCVKAAKKSQMC
jgi:ubiquinone/menaquinone biosynthesis C-methylase UbiE